jgi:hypothetical protein
MATKEWHWAEGTKYAIECVKTALLLNGAAAIALMTFANARSFSVALVAWPLRWFAAGAALAAIAFFLAYLTQLEYGNAEHLIYTDAVRADHWEKAKRTHRWAAYVVLASVVMFVVGILWASVVLA